MRIKNENNVMKWKTIALNGLNCFVTHDRLAMAAAIAYQVPIVIYLYYGDTHFAMFIKNDLLDEVTQKRFAIEALQKQIENMLEERHIVGHCMIKPLKPLPHEKSHCENMIRV
jgi:LmbE family N-acetylglucosaminyl deacetylase